MIDDDPIMLPDWGFRPRALRPRGTAELHRPVPGAQELHARMIPLFRRLASAGLPLFPMRRPRLDRGKMQYEIKEHSVYLAIWQDGCRIAKIPIRTRRAGGFDRYALPLNDARAMAQRIVAALESAEACQSA